MLLVRVVLSLTSDATLPKAHCINAATDYCSTILAANAGRSERASLGGTGGMGAGRGVKGQGLSRILDTLGIHAYERKPGPCLECNCPVGIGVRPLAGAHRAGAAPGTDAGAAVVAMMPALPPASSQVAGVDPSTLAFLQQHGDAGAAEESTGVVLLAYKYTHLADPKAVHAWQLALCNRLNLLGKIRVGVEGINLTCAGSVAETTAYIAEVCASPYFGNNVMTPADFKRSMYSCAPSSSIRGGAGVASQNPFDDLKVSLVEEIISLGMQPTMYPAAEAGKHLSPSEFHAMLSKTAANPAASGAGARAGSENGAGGVAPSDIIAIDCRNDYESKIGKFTNAIAPQVRKFSQWTQWAKRNAELLADKTVLMYCTGGIRCERGSAALKGLGVCKDVYQLQGGVHKYLEQYPDGLFRGKLYVFDNRQTVATNADVISKCSYCMTTPCDQLELCQGKSVNGCRNLMLSCNSCRTQGGHVYCCVECQSNCVNGDPLPKQGCACVRARRA